LPEGVEQHLRLGGFELTGYQVPDPWDFRRWLRLGRERRGEEAARQGNREDEPSGCHASLDSPL